MSKFQSYIQAGNVLEKQGQLDKAIAHYQSAIRDCPNISWLYLNLGKLLHKNGDLEDAIANYKKGIELHPSGKSFWFYYQLAEALVKQGQLDQATLNYQIAIQRNPKSFECYRAIGLIMIQQQQWDKALNYLVEALIIRPNTVAIYRDIGDILERQGFLDEATQCYQLKLPKRICVKYFPIINTEQTTQTLDTDNNATQIKVHASQSFSLTPPITVDRRVHTFFQRSKAITSETSVAIIPNSRAWLSGLTSVVFTEDNRILEDLSTGNCELLLSSEDLPPTINLEGNICSLVAPGGPIYGHWLVDLLPKLEILHQANISLDSIDNFIVNQYQREYQMESFDVLGIPSIKVIESEKFPHICAEQLIVPSAPRQRADISPWVCDFLRKEFLNKEILARTSSRDYPKRVYFSRKNAPHRRVLNEVEIMRYLETIGFQCIVPEQLTIAETAFLMSNAEAIISPHGSGTLNTVFCEPKTKIIEFFSTHLYRDCWIICNICRCEYYSLYCDSFDKIDSIKGPEEVTNNNKKDITVNVKTLAKLIERAELA